MSMIMNSPQEVLKHQPSGGRENDRKTGFIVHLYRYPIMKITNQFSCVESTHEANNGANVVNISASTYVMKTSSESTLTTF